MAQTVNILPHAEDRKLLLAIVADRNRPLKHVQRAKIVLHSDERLPVLEVARRAGVSRPAVWRWQLRYGEQGVDGLLHDKTRKPGRTPLSPRTVAKVLELTCSAPPGEATHWTGRAMANPRPRAATNRTQSALTFPDAAKRHASLSARSRRTLQQQRSGTRRAHDEAAHENLGRLSIARRRGRLRHNPWISVDGQKTGMEHHRSPAPGSGRSRKEPTRGLIPLGNLSSYKLYCD